MLNTTIDNVKYRLTIDSFMSYRNRANWVIRDHANRAHAWLGVGLQQELLQRVKGQQTINQFTEQQIKQERIMNRRRRRVEKRNPHPYDMSYCCSCWCCCGFQLLQYFVCAQLLLLLLLVLWKSIF